MDNNKSKSKLIKKSRLFLKRKNDNTIGKHTKYADDNLRRKIKNLVLKYALEFLNEKIRALYKGNIGKGISKEYYARATRAGGILTQKKIGKAIENAVNSEDSFNPAVIIAGGQRYWETHRN